MTGMSEEHPPFRYQLEPRGDYLYVRVEGKMTSRDVARTAALNRMIVNAFPSIEQAETWIREGGG